MGDAMRGGQAQDIHKGMITFRFPAGIKSRHKAFDLGNGEEIIGKVALKKQAYPLPGSGPYGMGGVPEDTAAASQRLEKAHDYLDQRRFANAVLAQQAVNLAHLKRERQIFIDLVLSIGVPEMVHADRGKSHTSSLLFF